MNRPPPNGPPMNRPPSTPATDRPGRPVARSDGSRAELRRLMAEAFPPEDRVKVMGMMRRKAQQGDVEAAALVKAYGHLVEA